MVVTADSVLVAGRYRLGERIGSGAMGIVWQAHDERLHRTVAVKQLLLQPGLSHAQAEEARRRCMREGRIAARLAHQNAITVYDVAEHDGDPWLVMEYLPSKSLATVLSERGTIPPQEAARIGTQVASALVAAHAAGIVHRDIKPANVLIAADGTVKITDFGISRATGDVTVTATGMLAGTPAYLAPEVAKGEDPTPAADIFSLGSTLYTAVEGHSPFGLSENTLALLYAVAAGKITPPRQAGPLTALLMQLLRVEPTERPPLSSVKETLTAVADGRAPVPNPGGAPTDRIAGNRMPMPPVLGPPTPPRPSGPPPWQNKDATRLDANPFTESASGGQVYQEPVPSRPTPVAAAASSGGNGNRTRSVLLTVLAIVAAVLVGILVSTLITSGDGDGGEAQEGTTAPVETGSPQPTGEPTTEETTTSTTTTTTTTTTPPAPTPADYENAVREYYGLLPGNPEEAWHRLTPNAQGQSGSYESYAGFWNSVQAVEVQAAQAQGNQVAATLRFVTDDGTSTESYSFTLVEQDGQLLIDSFQQGNGARNDDEDDG
jgi:eukaryotic-like serine/threonine-protein kinase